MAINVSDSIKAAQAEAEERKANSYSVAKMKDKMTNYKNRAVEGITDFTSAISDYLSGLGLMLSDTDAYSVYLHVMFLQDEINNNATYYYYLSKVNKKDKTKVTYFRDNITPKDAANINPTKKTCWIYQANTNTPAEDMYTYTSGLKEFLGLKYVTEAEVNTSINVGLTFSPSGNKHIGKHPYFYFTISKEIELLGTPETETDTYSDLDTCLEDVQKRCKKILDLIIKLENHRAKLVSVATNAVGAGESFGSKTIKIEESFKDANGDTLIIYVAEFLVTRELDTSNTGAPYIVNSTNSLTTAVSLMDIQEKTIDIEAGVTFPTFLYRRFYNSLSQSIIDGVIKEVEESASGGLLDSLISSSSTMSSNLDKALSSYVNKQIETAKASALAKMTSSIDKFQLSKAESNTLSDKTLSTAIDYASGGEVVNDTAYLIKIFTSMKEENNSEYKDIEILSDASFAKKVYTYKGWFVGSLKYEDVLFIVTKDTTCSYLYQMESEGLTLLKTFSTDNIEFIKISDDKGFVFLSYEANSECVYLYNGTVVIKKIRTIDKMNVFNLSSVKVFKKDDSTVTFSMIAETIRSDGTPIFMFSHVDLASIDNTMYTTPLSTAYIVSNDDSILVDYMERAKALALNYFLITSEFDLCADGGMLISENKCLIGVKHKDVSYSYNIAVNITDVVNHVISVLTDTTPISKIQYTTFTTAVSEPKLAMYKKLVYNYSLNKNIIQSETNYGVYDDAFTYTTTDITAKDGYVLYGVLKDNTYDYYKSGKKEFNYIIHNITNDLFILGEPCEENVLNGLYNVVSSKEITKAIENFNDVKSDVDSTLSDTTNKIDSLLGEKITSTSNSTTNSASKAVTEVASTKTVTVNLTVFGKSDKIITLPKIQVSTMVGFSSELKRHIALFQKIYDKCKDKEIKMETLNKSNRKYFIKDFHMSK